MFTVFKPGLFGVLDLLLGSNLGDVHRLDRFGQHQAVDDLFNHLIAGGNDQQPVNIGQS